MHDREPLNRDRTHVALSNHVADKDELLTAMLEAVADEIEPPKPTLRPSMPFGRGRSRPVKRSCAIRGRPSRGEVFALTCPGACNDLNSVQDCALSAPRCRSSRCRGGCSAVLRRRRGERRLPSHRGEARGYGRVGTSDGGGGRPPPPVSWARARSSGWRDTAGPATPRSSRSRTDERCFASRTSTYRTDPTRGFTWFPARNRPTRDWTVLVWCEAFKVEFVAATVR